MRYRFILEHEGEYPVRVMCRVLEVAPSGYHAWKRRPNSPRHDQDERLCPLIRRLFDESHRTYGSPRLTEDLRALGHRINAKRVARLMQMLGLRASKPARYVATTDSDHDEPIAPDRLQQDFAAAGPNQKWVSDITYIPTREGWLYLCVVIDLWSRRVVGWSFSDSLATELVAAATKMAISDRRPDPGCIFHSDRGCQYASGEFRSFAAANGLVQSMSRKGCCYDNAVAESFFHSLKIDWVHGRTFISRAEATQAIFVYLQVFYNRVRRHSTLGYLSPERFELEQAA